MQAIHYMKNVCTLTEIIQVLGKKLIYFLKKKPNLVPFEKSQYFRSVLRIKNFQTQNWTQASNWTLSIGENVKKTFSVFRADDFPSLIEFGRKQ